MHQECQAEQPVSLSFQVTGRVAFAFRAWGRSGCVFRNGEAAGSTVAARSEEPRLAGPARLRDHEGTSAPPIAEGAAGSAGLIGGLGPRLIS